MRAQRRTEEGDRGMTRADILDDRNKGRYRGPGYKQLFSHWRMKNGKWVEHKFYMLMN